MAQCDICGEFFANVLQLGPHKRRCWDAHCVHVGSTFTESETSEASEASEASETIEASEASEESTANSPTSLHSLCARECGMFWGRVERVHIHSHQTYNRAWTATYLPVQRMWDEYVAEVTAMCDRDFWLLFATVQNATTQVANSVFQEVYNLLKRQPANSTSLGHKWPRSLRFAALATITFDVRNFIFDFNKLYLIVRILYLIARTLYLIA